MSQDPQRQAKILIARGRAEDAVPILSRVLAEEPENPAAFCTLAQAYIALEAHTAALRFTERAILAAPDDEAGYRLQAIALNALDRPSEAHEALSHALRLAPEDPRPWEVHVDVLLALERLDEAMAAATILAELEPSSAGSLRALAQVSRARNDWAQVEQHARLYLAAAPQRAEARKWLSEALTHLGQAPEAIELLHRMAAANPGDQEARHRLGEMLDTFLITPWPQRLHELFRPSVVLPLLHDLITGRRQRLSRLSPSVRSYLRHEVYYRRLMPRLKLLAVLTIELALIWTGLMTQKPTLRPTSPLTWSAFAALWFLALWSSSRVAVWMLQHYDPSTEL
jgi:tetratricopeptide (TPR) repeat protein